MYLDVLGGIVISVFIIGPKVRGFKPGRGRYKSAARLLSERKQSHRSHVVHLQHVKEMYGYERDIYFIGKIQHFLHQVLLCRY
jgi:hypothetical protein